MYICVYVEDVLNHEVRRDRVITLPYSSTEREESSSVFGRYWGVAYFLISFVTGEDGALFCSDKMGGERGASSLFSPGGELGFFIEFLLYTPGAFPSIKHWLILARPASNIGLSLLL